MRKNESKRTTSEFHNPPKLDSSTSTSFCHLQALTRIDESTKDLQIPSYKCSVENSEEENEEFIHRANYDFEQLIQQNGGEWPRDSDIIRESLGFYQRKNNQSEREGEEESRQPHQQTTKIERGEIGDSETRRGIWEECTHKAETRRVVFEEEKKRTGWKTGVARPTEFRERHSIRTSEVTFGSHFKAKTTLKPSLRKPLLNITGELGKPAVKIAVPKDSFRKIKANVSKTDLKSIKNNAIWKIKGSKQRNSIMFQQKETKNDDLGKIAIELNLKACSNLSEIIQEIKSLKSQVHLLSQKRNNDLSHIIFEEQENIPVLPKTNLYNRGHSYREDHSDRNRSLAAREFASMGTRNSLSMRDWDKRRVSESLLQGGVHRKKEHSSFLRNKENLKDKSRVFSKLSKLVSLPGICKGN